MSFLRDQYRGTNTCRSFEINTDIGTFMQMSALLIVQFKYWLFHSVVSIRWRGNWCPPAPWPIVQHLAGPNVGTGTFPSHYWQLYKRGALVSVIWQSWMCCCLSHEVTRRGGGVGASLLQGTLLRRAANYFYLLVGRRELNTGGQV